MMTRLATLAFLLIAVPFLKYLVLIPLLAVGLGYLFFNLALCLIFWPLLRFRRTAGC